MRKLTRWAATHQTLLFTGSFVVFTLIAVCLACVWSMPTWLGVSIIIPPLVIIVIWISAAPILVMQEPLKVLNEQCDPYPLLQEIHAILPHKLPAQTRLTILINYCVGLHNVGNYQLAFDTLSSVHIDKTASMPPINKVVYYNNLTSICYLLQKHDEAAICYAKTLQIYNDLPENKLKKNLESALLSLRAEHHFYAGEYTQALELLNSIQPTCLLQEVSLSCQYAGIYMALGETDPARQKLQFILEKGNKLYAVATAEELLKQLDMA